MKRVRSCLFALGVAACVAPAPPKAHVVLHAPPSAIANTLAIPTDAAAAYALGFTWWNGGRNEDALRAFHSVMSSVARDPPKGARAPRMERGPLQAARDGLRAVLETEGGIVLANAETGALERFVRTENVMALDAVGHELFALTTASAVLLVDGDEGATVARIGAGQTIVRGASIFAVSGGFDTDAFVEVWSAVTRKRLCNLSEPTLSSIVSVALLDEDRAVLARDNGHATLWHVATCDTVISYPSQLSFVGDPAFSSDGHLLAYGIVDYDKTPVVGTTLLVDAQTTNVIATSHAAHMPTGFAFGKDVLAVGDLRKACLLRIPQMTLLACSPDVRPSGGLDDDLQDAHPTFVASGRALAIATSDGSMLVASVPALAPLWKGRARLAVVGGGAEYLFDDDNHALLVIGPTGAPTRVRTIADFETFDTLRETHAETHAMPSLAAIEASTCHVGSWLFPAAACSPR